MPPVPQTSPSVDLSRPACLFSIDVEDWFHILDIPGGPAIDAWDRMPSRLDRNFRRLLDLFDEYNARATCFVLGWAGERYSHLVKAASSRGHEVASHGYAHRLLFQMTEREFIEDTKRAKHLLEDLTGKPIRGYRAAGFSVTEQTPWFFERLAECGHTYSSSVFPMRRGHGGLPSAWLAPFAIDTPGGRVVEFPITVAKAFGVSICFSGGGYLRLMPTAFVRCLSRKVLAERRPVLYYIHPRELDPDQPRLPMSPVRRFKSYVNLASTEKKLRSILNTFNVQPFERYLADVPPKVVAG